MLERISETSVKEIIKIMKMESYQDLVAVLSKFKPKSKSGAKQKDQKKKNPSVEEKEKIESLDQKDKKKEFDKNQVIKDENDSEQNVNVANRYWIRGHNGAMLLDFLSAFCAAHEIDLFAINSEYLIENWKNITNTLLTELNKIITTIPKEKSAEFEQNQADIDFTTKKESKKELGKEKQKSSEQKKAEEKKSSSEKPEGRKEESNPEKVFDIDKFIDESENNNNEQTGVKANETSNLGPDIALEKESSKRDNQLLQLKEYKILYFDFDEFMELFNDNENHEISNNGHLTMKKFLKIFADPILFNEKTLFLIVSEGKYYSRLLSEIFDYELTVPTPTESDRKQIFEAFKESNLKCTYEARILASATHNWTLWDIKKLILNAIHRFKIGLCKYDSINSDFLLSLINTEKVLPKKSSKHLGIKGSETNAESNASVCYQQASTTDLSDPQLSMIDSLNEQLYQDAAFKDFDNVVRIIQDMISNKPINPDDMKIISKYSFILSDEPKKALSKMNQAKTRVDRIRKIKDK